MVASRLLRLGCGGLAVSGNLAAQGDDACGSAAGPARPGEFKALADDGFAVGFDRAGADEHVQAAEAGVLHAVAVGLEIGQRIGWQQFGLVGHQ